MDPVIDPLALGLDGLAARFVVEQWLPGLAVGVVRDGALAWTAALGSLSKGEGADEGSRTSVMLTGHTALMLAIVSPRRRIDLP
jgi:hypothetical protein